MREALRAPSAAVGLLLALVLASCGSSELVRDTEQYTPPRLYMESVDGSETGASGPPASGDPDFDAQLGELGRAAEAWRQSLAAGRGTAGLLGDRALETAEAQQLAAEPALAVERLAGPLALEVLERVVLARNPGVLAARATVQAALEGYDQATSLDQILRQYSAFTEALMPGVGPMKGREPPQMKFPYPDMVALKGQIVDREVAAAFADLQIARRDALTAARDAYWNLLFLQQAVDLTEDMQGLLDQLEAVAVTRYESAKASFQDVVKVRIRRESLREELRTLAEKQHNGFARLLRLADLEPGTPLGNPVAQIPDRSVPPLDALYGVARARRQELQRMDAMIGKMERMVRMGEVRTYPDPTLNLSLYGAEAVTQAGTRAPREAFPVGTEAGVGAGSPQRPAYASGQAFLRETRAKLDALRDRRRDMEAMVLLEVRNRWFELDRAVREEALYADPIVELSSTALEVSTRGYETGRVGFADVISSYTDWYQARLGLERRRADIGVARAQLAAAVGGRLPGAAAGAAPDPQNAPEEHSR